MEIEYSYLASNIKRLRTGRGLTQMELAQLLKVENTSISNYENGNSYPGMAKIARLSEIFGYSVDSLVLRPLSEWSLRDSGAMQQKYTKTVMIYTSLNDVKAEISEAMSYIILSVTDDIDGNLIGVYLEDDSLDEAGLNKGDTAIIRFQNTAADNDIAVISENDMLYIGRYRDEGDGKISVSPESKNKSYEKKYFDLSDDNVEIVGVMIKALVNYI